MTELKSVKQFGLLANGSTPNWEITVDESLDDPPEWLMELSGRHVEIVFWLNDVTVISQAIDFLNRGLDAVASDSLKFVETELALGSLDGGDVTLVWEVEDSLRLNLVAKGGGEFCCRLAFDEEDVKMLRDALMQVQSDR